MADARHDGNRTGGHGAGQGLVVEAHEVLERPTAAHEQYDVGPCLRSHSKRTDDGGARARALHRAGRYEDLHKRVSASQGTLDVIDDAARE